MKKITVLVLTALMMISFAGCKNQEEKANMWVMTSVQSVSDEGKVVAYGKNENVIPDNAQLIDLECELLEKELILNDKTNNKKVKGKCELLEKSGESYIYKLKFENMDGTVVLSDTVFKDGSKKPTLVITLGDYSMSFFKK